MKQARATRVEWTLLTDADLVARVVAGEADAFVALIQRYNRMVYRAARSVTGDDGEAEDVVQEAWTRAYAHIGEFRGDARIATWLVRIALNEALGRKRRVRPMIEIDEIDERQATRVIMFPSASNDPESDLSRRQVRRILEEAIDSLPSLFRTVFVLRAVEDMSVEDIALQLGIPEATVRTRMHRSRTLLRKTIEKKLSASLIDVFPFDGVRCKRLTDRVLAMIKTLDESR
jgi:RNA polymerase sigma-70 factor (ECF subfamily)